MTRVLHLLDQPEGYGDALTLQLSMQVAEAESNATDERHAWLLLGGQPMRDAADAAGLDRSSYRVLPMPRGLRRLPFAARPIKQLLSRADRVECWTVGAASLATKIGCNHAVPRFGQATLCSFAKRIIDSAAQAPSPDTPTRAELRQQWGVDEHAIVVALLADRPERIDGREMLLAGTFAYETLTAAKAQRNDVRLLCHPMMRRRLEATVLAELLHYPERIMQDANLLTPWRVLHACDIALAPDPLSAGLSMLWADALGLPVIAPQEPRLAALAELDHLIVCQSSAAKHMAYPLAETHFASNTIVG